MDFKSKFHFWKVYVMMAFGSLFFFGMGYLFMFVFQPKPGGSRTWGVLFGIACIAYGIYLLYIYVKQLPVIRINYNGVTLHSPLVRQQFDWSEIESVKYTGKDSFQFALGFQMETMVVHLKDKHPIKIFYEHYANGYLIQQHVKSYYEHRHPPVFINEKSVMSHELTGELFTTYKGTPLLSFRGISLWGFILFILVLTMKDGVTSKAILPVSMVCLFWYAINSYFCFYIEVSDNYLVIKNYFVPFAGKKYRLSDIQEMAVETYPKWPNCLRVITNSFQYRVFPCGLVRDKEWKSFMGMIRKKGINMRNEAI